MSLVKAVSLGIISLGSQIILIRLLLQVFRGNELIIGWALSVWLMGSATGSLLLGRVLRKTRMWNWQFLSIFPVMLGDYFFVTYTPKIFDLIPGVIPSFGESATIAFLALFPPAILCGSLFPYLAESRKQPEKFSSSSQINRIYIWESIGALIVSLTLIFLLFGLLDNLRIFLLFIIFFLISFLSDKSTGLGPRGIAVLCCIISLLIFYKSPDIINHINQNIYSPYKIKVDRNTPYGNIKVARFEEQTLIMNQGMIQYSSPDLYGAEIHSLLPLLSHSRPVKILYSGGFMADYQPFIELLGSVPSVTYVEKDPVLIQHQKELFSKCSQFDITFVQTDIRLYLQRSEEKFDIICLIQPEPVTLDLNRLYTREFYQQVGRHLNQQGILFFSISSSENYLNPSLCRYVNLIYNTLRTSFNHVFIIPGDQNYFLAGHADIFLHNLENWSERLEKINVDPMYLTPVYMGYRLSEDRLQQFTRQLSRCPTSSINTDFNIKGYLYHFKVWSSISAPLFTYFFTIIQKFKVLFISILLLFFVILKFLSRKGERYHLLFSLFLVGGLSLSIEIVLLLEYQIQFGTLYSGLAVLFGLFMAGLGLGAYRQGLLKQSRVNPNLRILSAGFAGIGLLLLVPVAVQQSSIMASWYFEWLFFPIMILLTGYFGGAFFSCATTIYFSKNPTGFSGVTYGIDLAGGIFFALVTSTILIPLVGMVGMIILIIILSILSMV
jgi:spermidine synthase